MAKSTRARPVLDTYGIGPRTAFTWQTQHDEFRQAVEEGSIKSLFFWERRAIALASGEAGNAAVVTLGLKNRSRAASGLHDAQRLEHSGPNGGPIQQHIMDSLDLRSFTDGELELLSRLLRVAGERKVTTLNGSINATCVSDIPSNLLRIA